MSTVHIPAGSVEYIRIPVATLDSSGDLEDPTGATVAVGFSASKTVEPESYEAATWETAEKVRLTVGSKQVSTPFKAKLLIGTGATDLTAGTYHVWVRLTDSPEVPVKRSPVTLTIG